MLRHVVGMRWYGAWIAPIRLMPATAENRHRTKRSQTRPGTTLLRPATCVAVNALEPRTVRLGALGDVLSYAATGRQDAGLKRHRPGAPEARWVDAATCWNRNASRVRNSFKVPTQL